MSLQTLTSVHANLDSRVAEWITSSLKEHPLASAMRRVAFVMPIDGEEELVLVNQKSGEITFANDLPTETELNGTLEVGGSFYTYIAAPEGAADAYSILCDTQNLDERAAEIDAVMPEETPEVAAAEPVETETDALYREITEAMEPAAPATIKHVTTEEIDNGFDSVLADLELAESNIKKEIPMTDPTTATRRTLSIDDVDPAAAEKIEDQQIALEVAQEIAAEDGAEGGDEAPEETSTAPDAKPAKKAKNPKKPVRERIIDKILTKLGLTELVSPERMFSKFTNAKHVKWVKGADLAAFNSDVSFDGDKSDMGKILNALTEQFGAENILNESAEITPTRVLEVATSLLRHGRIVHPVKAAKVDPETIPDTVKSNHPDNNTKVLQVWDGRHRTVALVLLYPDASIPVLVEDKTFEEAYDDALISNDTRDYGKVEAMTYFGLTGEIQTTHDIAASFALCKGNAASIMKWVGYHTIAKSDSAVLEKMEVPVYDKVPKGKEGMTTPSYGNIVKGAMQVFGKDNLLTLNDAKPYMNAVVLTINAAWDYIKDNAPERVNNIWTSYGTQVLGKVIGEAISKAVASETKYDAKAFGETVMKAVLGFISSKAESWNNQKPSELYVDLHAYAAGKGVTLPRINKAGAAASLLQQ